MVGLLSKIFGSEEKKFEKVDYKSIELENPLKEIDIQIMNYLENVTYNIIFENNKELERKFRNNKMHINDIFYELTGKSKIEEEYKNILRYYLQGMPNSIFTMEGDYYELRGNPPKYKLDDELKKRPIVRTAEDIINLSYKSIIEGENKSDITIREIGVIWNTLLGDPFFNKLRENSIFSALKRMKSGFTYDILIFYATNGNSLIYLLEKALEQDINLKITVIDRSNVLLNITEEKVKQWMENNSSKFNNKIDINYIHDSPDHQISELTGKYDCIIADFIFHQEFSLNSESLKKLRKLVNTDGFLISGLIPDNIRLRPLYSLLSGIRGFTGGQNFENIKKVLMDYFSSVKILEQYFLIIAE